ncbi:NPC intracellular cholesterol transporter 2 homolog a-like [Zophobas morio]|uniref:NPC intracellular cholesterol transporter 2 homolog a-like n=1 Tax=Zophobas morio TaxID=2755281 RepID=UPI003083C416
MKIVVCSLLVLSVISCIQAVSVSQCHDDETPLDDLSDRIKIGNCRKPPCRLRKNAKIAFEMKLSPDRDITKLTNSISAFVSGLPLPFPGYDQTDACKGIYSSDGKTQVGCPLNKGEDYLYRNEIEVLQVYPRLKLVVHWGLVDQDGKYLICLEVPARITN